MGEPVIRTKGLTRCFGAQVAVKDVSLTVNRGDVYGFLGLNGAGKTTTMRVMLGLLKPTSGTVEMFGRGGEAGRRAAMQRIGAMVESPAYYGHLSGLRNLELLGSLSKPTTRKRAEEVLELVGLAHAAHKRAADYSLGMKQRLAIGLALVSDPELVILDEPTNGLDPNGILEMRRLLRRLNEEKGVTFVVSSHLLHEIEMVCTRVGMLEAGEMVLEQSLAELMASVDSSLRLEAAPGEVVTRTLEAHRAVSEVQGHEDGRSWTFKADEEALPDLHRALVAAEVEMFSLARHRMSLEELFMTRSAAAAAGRLT